MALLCASKLAAHLAVSVRTIRRYVAAGLPHERTPGGHLRFDIVAVKSWKLKPAPEVSSSAPVSGSNLTGREMREADARGREIARLAVESDRRWAEKRAQKRPATRDR